MRRTNYPLMADPYEAPQQPRFRTDIRGPLRHVAASGGLVVSLSDVKKQLYVQNNLDDNFLVGKLKAAERWCEQRIPGHRQILTATYDLPVSEWWEGPLPLPRPPLQAVSSVKYYDTAGTETTLASTVYLVDSKGLRAQGTVERAPDQSWPSLQGDRRYPITIRYIAGYLAPVTAVAATDVLTSTGRAFSDNDQVRFWTAGGNGWALPAGLSADEDYWVRDASGQTFKVADVPSGTAIDITSTGSGLHFCGLIPEDLRLAVMRLVTHWYANRGDAASGSIPKEIQDEILCDLSFGSYR